MVYISGMANGRLTVVNMCATVFVRKGTGACLVVPALLLPEAQSS